jgi:hypothetical protein
MSSLIAGNMGKHKDIFVPLACKKSLAEANMH